MDNSLGGVEKLTTHKKLDEILFPVRSFESKNLMPDYNFSSNTEQSIYLPEQNRVIHTCPLTYDLVPNTKLIEPIYDKLVSVFGEHGFTSSIQSYEDKRFYVKFTIEKKMAEITHKDKICPQLIIRNSYDGVVKQSVGWGYYRLICSNGLMAFTSEVNISAKHHKGANDLKLGPLFKKLEESDLKIKKFQQLNDRILTADEFDRIVSAIADNKSIKYPKKMLAIAPLVAEKEAAELNQKMSAWLLYNGFNYPLNEHNFESALMPEERVRIDTRVLGTILGSLNIKKELMMN